MGKLKGIHQAAGWLVFGIAVLVFFFSAERTGSLWDVGEFILGAYKLQVVHPPGAPVFVLIGRFFTLIAELLSDDPADIAFAVNMMSGIFTAFTAACIAWVTIRLARLGLIGRSETTDTRRDQDIVLALGGVGAGLATAFTTSIYFSAVEGEVYALSTFFTALTLWLMIKWYTSEDSPRVDRLILLTVFSAALSTGVHLLSLLTFPALALFYYFKKYDTPTWKGMFFSAAIGVLLIGIVQTFVIVGIPRLWKSMELFTVNSLGMGIHSGLIPTLLIVGGVCIGGLYWANNKGRAWIQQAMVGLVLFVIAFSTIGVVVIRANVKPPINMNDPSDPVRLLSYLNREQYGERDLIRGPHFESRLTGTDVEDTWGRVGDKYEKINYKITPVYDDKMAFPRMSDNTQGRSRDYKMFMGLNPDQPTPPRRPNQADNISYFINYQIGWMYWRYFMWNFSGRQNGDQGFYPWDKSAGHWITGINFLDELRMGELSELNETARTDPSRNTYFAIPFVLGLIGLFWHARRRRNDFLGLMALFLITGLGIIVYTNQPPHEPRERDYVLVGSFMTFCIWLGMAAPAIYEMLVDKVKLSGIPSAALGGALVLIAPLLMVTQNYDDHSRLHHTAARDYAANFLNSVDENAIIFTYGDNDTYPLWYAQEVEGIRPDVRVVNLSLIAVDWYIENLRRKINESPAIKMTIPQDQLLGRRRNQVPYFDQSQQNRPMALQDLIQFIAEDNPLPTNTGRSFDTYYPTTNVFLPIDRSKAVEAGLAEPGDTTIASRIPVRVGESQLLKDELAILDLIASNYYDRPIYWAVTTQPSKFMGLNDYLRLEGLGLRLTAVRGQSEPQFTTVIGSGSVDGDKIYDRVMNDWRWGNFDKYDTYVNNSYGPAIQSMQLVIRRAANDLLRRGETEKALALTDKYFEAFPHMNFSYGYQAMTMMTTYWQAQAWDRAKPHMEILARETMDRLDYYFSMDEETREISHGLDIDAGLAIAAQLNQAAQSSGREDLVQLVNQYLGTYTAPPATEPTTPGLMD